MKTKLPYIDLILSLFDEGSSKYKNVFKKNMHWGYWENPKPSLVSGEEFIQAMERLNQVFLDIAKIKNGETIVDIGCGFGGTIESLEKAHKRLTIYGINIDDRQIEIAKNSIISINENTINFIQSDASVLPFEDDSIDTIIALECIFHFKDRNLFFQEAKRVLKAGGKLTFSDFVPNSALIQITKLISDNSSFSGFFGKIYADYSEDNYRKLCHKVGFKSLKIFDITDKTLPTYSFLLTIGKNLAFKAPEAIVPVFLLFNFSLLKIIRYQIFSCIKE